MTFQLELPPSAAVLHIYVHEGEDGANIAAATLEGRSHEAISQQNSALFRLCRSLLSEGAADTPYQVIQRHSGTVSYTGDSWHRLAKLPVIVTEGTGTQTEERAATPGRAVAESTSL